MAEIRGPGGFWPCREAGGFEPRKVDQAQTVPELNASPAPQGNRTGMAGHAIPDRPVPNLRHFQTPSDTRVIRLISPIRPMA